VHNSRNGQQHARHFVGAEGTISSASGIEANVRGVGWSACTSDGGCSDGGSRDAAHGRRRDSRGAGTSTSGGDVEGTRLSQDTALAGSIAHRVDPPVVSDRPAASRGRNSDASGRDRHGLVNDAGNLLGRIDKESLEAGRVAGDGGPAQDDGGRRTIDAVIGRALDRESQGRSGQGEGGEES